MAVFPDAFDAVAATKQLQRFNRIWGKRYQRFQSIAPPRKKSELSRSWENWLPISEYLADLKHVLAHVVGAAMLPRALNEPRHSSISDLWRSLPNSLAGKLTFEFEELLPLACSLAAPPRFGSAAGRYPEQLEWLAANAGLPDAFTGVDYGCGTGQGTWELAGFLAAQGTGGSVVGVTAEPLEVWMATNRTVPHLADTEQFAFPPEATGVQVSFAVGDILDMPGPGRCNLIMCNGLIGGPFVCNRNAYQQLWQRFEAELCEDGILIVGDRFHDGRRRDVHAFAMATPTNFTRFDISGSMVFVKNRV